MRMKHLMRRSRWVAGCASLFMVGMYVGRLSILHTRIESIGIACYLVSCFIWLGPVYLEHRREEKAFRQAMKELSRDIASREMDWDHL